MQQINEEIHTAFLSISGMLVARLWRMKFYKHPDQFIPSVNELMSLKLVYY